MQVTLTAFEVWLDSMRPVIVDGVLTDVIAVYNVRYVDEQGHTVSIRNENVPSFAMLTAQQITDIQAIYTTTINNIKTEYGIS